MNEQQKRILIVDDEKDLREALATAFSTEGFVVETASDGEEALSKAVEEAPDLMLLDVVMPKMGGMDVLEQMSKEEWGKGVKVIVLTALEDLDTVSQIVERGGHEYLVKTDWKLEDIVGRVKERLDVK